MNTNFSFPFEGVSKMTRKKYRSRAVMEAAMGEADRIGPSAAAKKHNIPVSTLNKWRAKRKRANQRSDHVYGSPEGEVEKKVQKQGLKELCNDRVVADMMIRLIDDDLVIKIHNRDGSVRGTLTLSPDGLSWINANTKQKPTRCVPYDAMHNLITSGLFN